MTENNHFIIDKFDHTHVQWLSPLVTKKYYEELLQKFETSQKREVKLEHQLAQKDNELTEKNQELTQKNQKLAEKNEKIRELDRTIKIQDENMIKNIAENEKIHATLESLEVEFKKMHVTQSEEHEKLKAEITDLQDELVKKNNNEKHYQNEEKKSKQQIEKLHREIVHNKESAETQINMIQKIAKEVAEELVKKVIDQYQSRFHELKETSDAIIATLKQEIINLQKQNKQNK